MLSPCKQSLFTFHSTNMSTILHHFHYTSEFSIIVSYGYINYVDKNTWFIYPEFGLSLLTTSEFFNNFFYKIQAFWRVAISHFSTNNTFASWKHSVLCIGVKLNYIILI